MISSTFRHSILALGLLTLAGPAHAQGLSPALAFHPTKAWTTATSGSQCMMQSEFNNGFVVAFGGENKNLDTLDIDFRQDAFEAGKTYDVGFRIPGKPPQKFPAVAYSARELNVNVRGGRLASELRTASAFDLGVDDNNFRFFLTGFAAGAKNLEQCLGIENKQAAPRIQQISTAPEEGKAPPPPPVDFSARAEEELPEAKISDTKIETMEILPSESEPALPFIPPVKGERMSEKLARQIEKNPEIVKIENTPQARTETKTAALEISPPVLDEPQDLPPLDTTPLDFSPADAPKTEMLADASIAPQEIQKQMQAQQTAAQIQPAVQKPAPVPATVTEKKSPPVTVRHEQVAAKIVKFPSPDAPFAEAQLVSAQPFASPTKADPAILRKISELESTVQTLKAENVALNNDLKNNVRETAEERVSISSDNWNLERATMRFNEGERELKRMGQQLQQERAQCTQEKQELESQLFDPQVTSQQQMAKLADLEQKLAESRQKIDEQRSFYESRIQAMEAAKATQ